MYDIIDTYFRDTLYYKSQHQVDSYTNLFFQIKMVLNVRGENPFIIGVKIQDNFNYEKNLFW